VICIKGETKKIQERQENEKYNTQRKWDGKMAQSRTEKARWNLSTGSGNRKVSNRS